MRLYYIANLRLPTEKAHGTQIMRMCEAFADAVGRRVFAPVTLVVPFRWRTGAFRGTGNVFAYYGVQKNFRIVRLPSLDLFPLARLFPFLDRAAFAIQYGSFLFSCYLFLTICYTLNAKRFCIVYTRDSRIARLALRFTKHVFLELHTVPKQDDVKAAQGAQGVITVTRGLKNALVDLSIRAQNILVAPDAVAVRPFSAIMASSTELCKQLHLPLDAKLIGYAGRLKTFEQEKGIPELLEAFALLQQVYKDTRLVIVGADPADADRYMPFLRKHGIAPRVHFTGHVPPTEVPKYLKSFDILVAPFPKSAHYEIAMSPLKIFEYMAANKPMVVSDLPSLREVLSEDSAYFFKPGNVQDLMKAMERILADSAEASRKASHAQKISQEHTWQQRAKSILEFMDAQI